MNIFFELDDACIVELSGFYREIVNSLALHGRLKVSEIFISQKSLSLAFSESSADLAIMSQRRKPKDGISVPKIAGIIAFRLARFAPINVCGEALESDVALKLNELAAIALAMKCVMHLDIRNVASKHVTQELQYTLVRRHMNQETLGLVFEMLNSVKTQDEAKKKDIENDIKRGSRLSQGKIPF